MNAAEVLASCSHMRELLTKARSHAGDLLNVSEPEQRTEAFAGLMAQLVVIEDEIADVEQEAKQ